MVKKKQKRKAESDNVFILKLVLYLMLGSQWLRITKGSFVLPIPYGALIGLIFAKHEHFKMDRKIHYAILLLSMFLGFWLPMGIELVIK